MRILISNDDGIDAPGIRALELALEGLGEIWVVAPATGQSAKSHALTMHEPLEIQERGPRRFAVTGTPADSVYVAIHRVLPDLPDIVVSGINRGANIGEDVHYSGTVAAAREGFSLGCRRWPCLFVWILRARLRNTIGRAEKLARRVARVGPPHQKALLLSLNVPDVPEAQLGRPCLCSRPPLLSRWLVDPRGGRYFWLGGPHSDLAPNVLLRAISWSRLGDLGPLDDTHYRRASAG